MIQYNIKKKITKILAWCFATLPRKIISCLVIAGILLSSAWFLFFKPAPVEAGWWDEDWLYRRSVTVTNNTTAETDVYVEITSIDTSDAGKVQADCGDLRFTKKDGTQLDYYIVSGCRTSSTIVHVKLDTLQAGAQTIYFYYGNSSAVNGFIGADFSTVASNYSVGIGSEEKGTGPVLWLKFDEGYGAFAYNSTENDAGKLPGTQLDTSHPLANGLVGLWLMNENTGTSIADLSGNGNIGSLIADTHFVPGKFGSALDFDGTGDYISIPNIPSIAGAMSVIIWVRMNAWDESGTNPLVMELPSNSRWLFKQDTGGAPAISWVGAPGEPLVMSLPSPGWHQLAATQIGTKGVLFLDGVLKNNNDFLGAISTGTGLINIGGDGTDFMEGQIDHVMIYNRALTADEISQLYREPFAMVSDTGASRITGGASWTNSGKFGKALDFDGTDGVVTVIRDANVNLQNKSAYSISTWIYPHSDGGSNVGEIIDKGTNTYIRVANEGSDGYLDLEAKLDLASGDPTLNIVNALRINRWSHILLVWEDDDDDEFTIYVNGIDMGTSSGGSGAPADDSGNDLLIGGSTGANFDGIIDEVIIYPYARSSVQVKRSYNKGAAARIGRDDSWLTDGLVGYWKMDESSWSGAANEVVDSSGAGNHGVRAGNATTGAGKFGKGGTFDGTGDYVDVGDTSQTGIKTVSFWVKPDAVNVTEESLDLNGTAYVKITNGTVTAQGFTSPTIYVNGVVGSTVTTSWNLVVITTDTGINASDLDIGRLEGSTEFDGNLDDVRIYNRVLSGFEIRRLYDWGPGPIAHWKFDKGSGTTAYDTSENSNDGTLQDDTTWKGSAECKYGNCLDFDGDGDYVIIADDSSLDLDGNFTLSIWIKPNQIVINEMIITKDDGTNGGKNYILSLGEPNNAYQFFFETSDGTNYICESQTGYLTANDWNFLTAVYNGTDSIMYINGVDRTDGTCSFTVTPTTNNDVLQIGEGRYNNPFNGQIDDVKIYNYARTQKQIIEDMLGGRPAITETTSSPGVTMGYWKFDEGYGTTAQDSSGRDNDLTLSAESWTTAGKFGRAWDGDGAKWLSRTDDADFDFTASEDFSISMWFKSDSATNPGSNEFLIDKESSSPGYAIYMDTSGDVVFGIDDDSTWSPDDDVGNIGSDYYDNTWHHVVAVKTGTTSIEIYVDGLSISSDTSIAATGTLANSDSLVIGSQDTTDDGDDFNGDIDEVKIYRFALSPEEILLDYNKGKAVIMGAVGTESDGTTPSWSQSRAYCPPGYAGLCSPPVGEYKFDERSGSTAYDTSGNTNNGTITGTIWKGSADCKYNACLNFDGTDDVVTITQDSSINMSGKSGYTMSVWVYPNSDGENDVGEIIDKGTNTYLRLNTESDGLDVEAKLDLATTDATLNIDDIIFTNNWYHIVMTYEDDGDDEITIYINGINQGSSTDGVGSLASSDTNDLLIGGDTSANFDGLIDDVKIFDYALSQEQVAWIYNKGKPVGQWKFDEAEGPITYNSSINDAGKLPGLRLDTDHSLSTGLVGLWLMNENTGTSIADLSGNGNTGTFNGDPQWAAGKFGSALDFDGTGDYVDLGDDFTNFLNFTYSFLVKVISSTGDDYIIDNSSGAVGYMIRGRIGRQDLNVYDTGGSYHGLSYPILDYDWNHIVWVHSTVGDSVYVNGKLYSSNTWDASAGVKTTATTVKLGAQWDGTSAFSGLIDHVMLYNRALSAAEIQQLYREPFAMISDTGASLITGTDVDWVTGKYNSALDFDGTDDVVTVVANQDIDLNNKIGYSVCGWINPDTDGEGNAGEWFSKGSSYIRVDTESGATVKVSARFDLATDATLSTSKTIPTGSWSHICTTWKDDDDDELTIYINGLNAGSSTDGSGVPVDDSASQLYIGGDSSNNFDGDIDEVTIYNYELTSQQVKLDYNQGAALRFGD